MTKCKPGWLARGTRVGVEPGSGRTSRTGKTSRTGYKQKSITPAAIPRILHAKRYNTSQRSAIRPRAINQSQHTTPHTDTHTTGRKDRGMGKENCGGTTQLSCPNAASRGEVFCKSFRRKAGRFAKILRRIFAPRHTHTAVNIPLPVAPGAMQGAAIATLQKSHGQSCK